MAVEQLGHVVGVGGALAGEAGRVHARAPRRGRRPRGRCRRRWPAARWPSTRAWAFSRALSTRVVPVSSTSGDVVGPGQQLDHRPPRISAISAALWGLAVARTNGRHRGAGRPGRRRCRQHLGLGVEDLGDAVLGQREQVVELALGERQPLGRALNLHEAARRGHDDVHVDLGACCPRCSRGRAGRWRRRCRPRPRAHASVRGWPGSAPSGRPAGWQASWRAT